MSTTFKGLWLRASLGINYLLILEWLEVRLDVGDDKILMYKCRIEALNSDGDALKEECCLARIAGSGTQYTLVRNSRELGATAPRVSSTIDTKRTLGIREYLTSFRGAASSAAPAATCPAICRCAHFSRKTCSTQRSRGCHSSFWYVEQYVRGTCIAP